MTPTESTILWVYAAVVAIWPVRALVVWLVCRNLEILGPRSPRFEGPAPLVTAIIPAKDEESALADCLATVTAQTYPNLEILVVNDRSRDRTGAIAADYAGRDPRVRVLTIDNLPSGWTGKTHALHLAVAQARGDWFWFLDADTRHAPDNLAIVMEYARRHDAALVSLLPEMRCETFWERVVQPLASVMLIQSFPLFRVNNPRARLAFANGQYILIQRAAYAQAGGHQAVRGRFVEDIGLAQRVKDLGLPIRVVIALGLGSTRMYASLGQLIRGWSRILYDALGRSPWRLLAKFLDPIIFSQSGQVAFAVAVVLLSIGRDRTFALGLLGLSLTQYGLAYLVLRRLYRLSVPETRHVAWFPLANLVMNWVVIRALAACATGRITWRGTEYRPAASVQPASH